ncbi:MAG: hypothetical protein ACR2ND_10500 [Solirubrobacteraceae bacterium]
MWRRPQRDRLAALLVAVLAGALWAPSASVATQRPATAPGVLPPSPAAARPGAPDAPPGAAGAVAVQPGPVGADPTGSAAAGAADQNATGGSAGPPNALVSNGFGSPGCTDRAALAALDPSARVNCAASGLTTSAAPIGHYEFDIHIDTGPTHVGGTVLDVFQSLVLEPLWMCLLWLIGVVLVALQWCYSIDLLSPATIGPIAGGLSEIHREVTQPWLALVLALAGVVFAYNGLVRRRVAETLGQAALMLAMMAGGLWVVVDPAGTIGELHGLANGASLGALAASSAGDAGHPQRGLETGLHKVFDSAISGPWCYLEFGDVAWCRNAVRFDPRLRAEARRIAAVDRAVVACTDTSSFGGLPVGVCAANDPLARVQLTGQADALDSARTNGAVFLALPPGSKPRNSINADAQHPSLLHTLCGSSDATSCPSSTGPQAQFRTEQGTWPRAGGLLLIAIGSAGMLALLAFLGLRLLASAILATLLLLLAPVAVLAPAFGDAGRAGFRAWATRLVGAVLAKLVYSIFLGVVLLMLNVLESFPALGWWTQWLLIAAFWWIVFGYRHKLLEHAIVERATVRGGSSLSQHIRAARQATRLATGTVRGTRAAGRGAADVVRKIPNQDFHVPRRPIARSRRSEHQQPGVVGLEQTADMLGREHADALATVATAPALEGKIAQLEGRRERLRREGAIAAQAGDRRREVSLGRRAGALGAELDGHRATLEHARSAAPAGERRRRETGQVHDAAQRELRGALLDSEAERRPLLAAAGDKRTGRRDYAQLAQLVGLPRARYVQMAPAAQRAARLEIDRRLEARRAETLGGGGGGRLLALRRPGGRRRDAAPRPEPRPLTRRGRQFSRRFTGDRG